MIQPQRGCGRHASTQDTTPLGLLILWTRFPRVARTSQPWALGRNPFGIHPKQTKIAGQEQLLMRVRSNHTVRIAEIAAARIRLPDWTPLLSFETMPA